MRLTFEKSLCKCPRCVAKRRLRFLALSGACIAMAADCYILVGHSRRVAPPSLNMPEAPAEGTASDASPIPRENSEPVSRALAQPATSLKQLDTETTEDNLEKDGFSTGSLELAKNLAPPDGSRNRAAFPLSNPIGEAPMPHTNGWQTVPLADASKSASEVDVQRTPQRDGDCLQVWKAIPLSTPWWKNDPSQEVTLPSTASLKRREIREPRIVL